MRKRYLLGILVFVCFILIICMGRQIAVYMGWQMPYYLSSELKEEVEKAYKEQKGRDLYLSLEAMRFWREPGCTRYYGTYRGAVVFISPSVAELFYEMEIEGEKFEWYVNKEVVYKDGKFMTLEEAYEQGILTHADIKRIMRYENLYWKSRGVER